jgi:hypothetical protein
MSPDNWYRVVCKQFIDVSDLLYPDDGINTFLRIVVNLYKATRRHILDKTQVINELSTEN